AILPFAAEPTDDTVAHLGAGLADAVTVRLHHMSTLAVRPASAGTSFDPAVRDPTTFGRALGVDAVLAGRIEHAGDRLRVSARLIRVADGSVAWAAEFDEPPVNVLT